MKKNKIPLNVKLIITMFTIMIIIMGLKVLTDARIKEQSTVSVSIREIYTSSRYKNWYWNYNRKKQK